MAKLCLIIDQSTSEQEQLRQNINRLEIWMEQQWICIIKLGNITIQQSQQAGQKMDQSQTEPYYQSVAITIIVFNAISLLSLSFVLGIYIANWKKIASFPMRLVLTYIISCFVQNLYVILLNPISIHNIQTNNGVDETSGYCKFQAFLKVTFDLSSIIWTTMIIYSIYASVVRKISIDSNQYIYLGIAFVLPFLAALVPIFINDTYGFVDYFCWFSSSDPNQVFWFKMGYFFIPLWLLFVINLLLAIRTYVQLRRIQLQPRLLTIFQRLMLFPLIMFITGLFATINLIYTQVTGTYLAWLDITGIVLLSLYGFFNSVVLFSYIVWHMALIHQSEKEYKYALEAKKDRIYMTQESMIVHHRQAVTLSEYKQSCTKCGQQADQLNSQQQQQRNEKDEVKTNKIRRILINMFMSNRNNELC